MSSSSELVVRAFEAGDAEAIRELALDRFVADPAWTVLPSDLLAIQVRAWSASVLDRLATGELGLLAAFDGRVVGLMTWAPDADAYRISELTVCSTARRRGVGTLLLERVLAQADADRVPSTLRVLEGNPAVSIYVRLGFVPVLIEAPNLVMTRAPRVAPTVAAARTRPVTPLR